MFISEKGLLGRASATAPLKLLKWWSLMKNDEIVFDKIFKKISFRHFWSSHFELCYPNVPFDRWRSWKSVTVFSLLWSAKNEFDNCSTSHKEWPLSHVPLSVRWAIPPVSNNEAASGSFRPLVEVFRSRIGQAPDICCSNMKTNVS